MWINVDLLRLTYVQFYYFLHSLGQKGVTSQREDYSFCFFVFFGLDYYYQHFQFSLVFFLFGRVSFIFFWKVCYLVLLFVFCWARGGAKTIIQSSKFKNLFLFFLYLSINFFLSIIIWGIHTINFFFWWEQICFFFAEDKKSDTLTENKKNYTHVWKTKNILTKTTTMFSFLWHTHTHFFSQKLNNFFQFLICYWN